MSEAKEIPVADRIDHKLEELGDQIDSSRRLVTLSLAMGSLGSGQLISSIMEHNSGQSGFWGTLAVGGLSVSIAAIRDLNISRKEYHELDMERLNYPEYAPEASESPEA